MIKMNDKIKIIIFYFLFKICLLLILLFDENYYFKLLNNDVKIVMMISILHISKLKSYKRL